MFEADTYTLVPDLLREQRHKQAALNNSELSVSSLLDALHVPLEKKDALALSFSIVTNKNTVWVIWYHVFTYTCTPIGKPQCCEP